MNVLKLIVGLVLFFGAIVSKAAAMTFLWGWFIVDLGAPELSFMAALGILAIMTVAGGSGDGPSHISEGVNKYRKVLNKYPKEAIDKITRDAMLAEPSVREAAMAALSAASKELVDATEAYDKVVNSVLYLMASKIVTVWFLVLVFWLIHSTWGS